MPPSPVWFHIHNITHTSTGASSPPPPSHHLPYACTRPFEAQRQWNYRPWQRQWQRPRARQWGLGTAGHAWFRGVYMRGGGWRNSLTKPNLCDYITDGVYRLSDCCLCDFSKVIRAVLYTDQPDLSLHLQKIKDRTHPGYKYATKWEKKWLKATLIAPFNLPLDVFGNFRVFRRGFP